MTVQANSPKTVIFDLGAVLIDWNPRYLYRQLFSDESEMEWFLKEVCSPAWNLSLDKGRPFADGVAEKKAAFPQYSDAIEAYQTRWIEMIGGPIEDTVKILQSLAERGTQLHALTNWSAETFPLVRHDPTYSFLKLFGKIIVSGEIGMIKPDAEIFHHTLEVIGADASQCLFIDDNPANCESAQRLGLDIHLFKSPGGLETDLAKWIR